MIRQIPSRQTDLQGFCYVKIGRSTWPRHRLAAVQNGSPFELELYAWSNGLGFLEKKIHEALSRYHIRGEWFALTYGETMKLVSELREMSEAHGLGWWEMSLTTWDEIDSELDQIEEGDTEAVATLFLRVAGTVIISDGRRGKVNLTNFSTHIGVPRHRFEVWVTDAKAKAQARYRETA